MPRRTGRSNRETQLSVVIPVYNEAATLRELWRRLAQVLAAARPSFEVVFIDDGCSEASFEVLCSIRRDEPRVKILRLVRNFGQHAAVSAGFDVAEGQYIVTLDSDLQNPPEEIPKLLEKLDDGFEVVAGWRQIRQDRIGRKFFSRITNILISRFTKVKLHDYGCMLRGYRREVVERLRLCREPSTYLTALASWVGARTAEVPVE